MKRWLMMTFLHYSNTAEHNVIKSNISIYLAKLLVFPLQNILPVVTGLWNHLFLPMGEQRLFSCVNRRSWVEWVGIFPVLSDCTTYKLIDWQLKQKHFYLHLTFIRSHKHASTIRWEKLLWTIRNLCQPKWKYIFWVLKGSWAQSWYLQSKKSAS